MPYTWTGKDGSQHSVPRWPEPTEEAPDFETLEEWMREDGGCEATDGCWTEVDGVCPHGYPSWILALGLV